MRITTLKEIKLVKDKYGLNSFEAWIVCQLQNCYPIWRLARLIMRGN